MSFSCGLTRCFCMGFNAIVATIVTQPFTAKDFKKERSISSSSLRPILNLEIPDLAMTAWIEVVQRTLARSREITNQRLNVPEINANWQLLHRFEYEHFYSSWVAAASRFRACAIHNQSFTEIFQLPQLLSPTLKEKSCSNDGVITACGHCQEARWKLARASAKPSSVKSRKKQGYK